MRRISAIVLVGLLTVFGLFGCAGVQVQDNQVTAAEALTAVAGGYAVAMSIGGDLYRTGAIDGVARSQVLLAGNAFYSAYTTIVKVMGSGDITAVQDAIQQLSAAGSNLTVLISALAGTNAATVAAVVSVTSILAQAYLAPAISRAIEQSGDRLTDQETALLLALVKPPESYFGLSLDQPGIGN